MPAMWARGGARGHSTHPPPCEHSSLLASGHSIRSAGSPCPCRPGLASCPHAEWTLFPCAVFPRLGLVCSSPPSSRPLQRGRVSQHQVALTHPVAAGASLADPPSLLSAVLLSKHLRPRLACSSAHPPCCWAHRNLLPR